MSQIRQGSHSETETERLQRVERFLHSSTSWEPTTPPPADLCTRVAERIAGRSPRPVERKTRLSSVSYGLIASAACAAIVMALVLPGRVSHTPTPMVSGVTIETPGAGPTGTASRLPRKVGAGFGNGMTLASYIETQAAPEATEPAVLAGAEPRQAKRTHEVSRRPYLPQKRNRILYASQNSVRRPLQQQRQNQPQTLAEGPYPAEWGPQDDMVALVPVVLTEYEPDPHGDGSPESLHPTYTPAVVAISIKQDALGEASVLPLPKPEASTPVTTPMPVATPMPETIPMPEASPTPGPTSEPR